MFGKITAVIGLAALIEACAPYAGPSHIRAGEWSKETRQIGNKVTIEVFDRAAPYALTGDTAEGRTSSRGWKRETRQLGNKVTIDVFTR